MRNGWLYARGVSNNKGNLYALLRAALDLAEAGQLPVNVRVLCDGEEEIGGGSVVDHLATIDGPRRRHRLRRPHGRLPPSGDHDRAARAGGLPAARPQRRAESSGLYGGAAANAVDDLTTILNAVIGKESEFADGTAAVSAEERAGWARASLGRGAAGRGRRMAARRPSHQRGLRAHLGKAVVHGALGRCRRSDHHQDVERESADVAPGARAGTRADVRTASAAAAGGLPCARHASARSLADGPSRLRRPQRAGAAGSLRRHRACHRGAPAGGRRQLVPIGAALVGRGIPTILSGFGAAEDDVASPNEGMELRRLEWALGSARSCIRTWWLSPAADGFRLCSS